MFLLFRRCSLGSSVCSIVDDVAVVLRRHIVNQILLGTIFVGDVINVGLTRRDSHRLLVDTLEEKDGEHRSSVAEEKEDPGVFSGLDITLE